MTRRGSRSGLHVRAFECTAVCEWCGATFRHDEVEWVHGDWITRRLRRGYVIATLCPECSGLALDRCWRCGELTGREDGLCADCVWITNQEESP